MSKRIRYKMLVRFYPFFSFPVLRKYINKIFNALTEFHYFINLKYNNKMILDSGKVLEDILLKSNNTNLLVLFTAMKTCLKLMKH